MFLTQRPLKVIVTGSVLVLGVAIVLAIYSAQRTNTSTTPVVQNPRSQPDSTLQPSPAAATVPVRPDEPRDEKQVHDPRGHVWGGALNSAAFDGTDFFNVAATRKFVAAATPAEKKYVVELNSRAFLPLREEGNVEAALGAEAARAPHSAYLQFQEHPTEAQRAELKAQGIELVGYVSGYAWTARGTPDAFRAALRHPSVRAIARIDPRDKLNAQVFRGETPKHALSADGRTRFAVLAPPKTTAAEFMQKIQSIPELANSEVRTTDPSVLGPRFEVVADAAAARQIAALEVTAFVEYIDPPAASRDATTDEQSNVVDVRDGPPNLSGSGIKVAVREIGKPLAHVDFTSRLQFVDSDGDTSSEQDHATAVCGQIASSGVAQPTAKGTAPAASLLVYSLMDGDFATADVTDAAGKGARLSNHSYGPRGTPTGDYQTTSANWDSAIRTNNLLGFFANFEAGTAPGYIKVDYFVGAKNTICVSATDASAHAGDDNPLRTKSDGIAFFSAFGPMADGRVKPDIVALGDNVTLTQGTNSAAPKDGTSFSTPAVTGIAALVFQHYKAKTGSEPSAALGKALLCNSATDLGQTGPDAVYGFGIANAEAAVNTIDLFQSASVGPFFEGSLSNGQSAEFSIDIQNPTQLKVTLCWMDVAGNPAVAKALVNDLDLELQSPDGTVTVLPYSLTAADPSAAATRTAANTVDPIEQVIIDTPAVGIWKVLVRATSIPSGTQSFAVVFNKASKPLPLTPIILASPSQGAAPLAVSFSGTASSGNITSYTWDFGDNTGGTGAEVQHTYAEQKLYTVTLTISGPEGTKSEVTTILVTKRAINAFASKALGKLDFSRPGRDKLSMTLVVPELVRTPQQVRQMIADGDLDGTTYIVRISGIQVASFTVDAKGRFKSREESLTLNLVRGELKISVSNGSDIIKQVFAKRGMTALPTSSGLHDLPAEVETADAVYAATFKLLYVNRNGKSGSGKTF
jgi:PKD repeat protein